MILRNPSYRAYSAWKHNLKTNIEKIVDFKKAINLSGKRDVDSENIYTNYLEEGLYGKHLNNFLNYFSFKQIHITFFEDFIRSPEIVVKDAICFLDSKMSDVKIDTNKIYMDTDDTPKHQHIDKFSNLLKFRFPKISKKIKYLNRIGPISSKSHQFLIDYYKDDIELLEKITGRNLNSWKY